MISCCTQYASLIEKRIDEGSAMPSDNDHRLILLQEIEKIDKFASMDIIQKTHVKWDIEGDENSKFFHGLINQKRRNQMINGIMVEGNWITNPCLIKDAFLQSIKKIPSSRFTGDVIITTNWNDRDMDNIIHVLHVFYLASGLKINIHKSNIYGIGAVKSGATRTHLKQVFSNQISITQANATTPAHDLVQLMSQFNHPIPKQSSRLMHRV
ncbi:hypothetical protein Tco_0298344 [Tanacetum coccineum]